DGAADRLDLRASGLADGDGHLQRGVELATAEQLDLGDPLRDQAPGPQAVERDLVASSEVSVEQNDVDAVDLDAVRVDEAALRHPPLERVLPALEVVGHLVVARELALDAAGRGLAAARADATSDALATLTGADRRRQ